MSGHAIQRLVRQSPRKMRLVIDLIRGNDVPRVTRLDFTMQKRGSTAPPK